MNVSGVRSGMKEVPELREPVINQVQQYIKETWDKLVCSWTDAADPKMEGTSIVYYPKGDPKVFDIVSQSLAVEARPLPEKVQEHGLLYLPEPFVVPGGRFQEMYGWDSYFQTLGLLQDGKWELAMNTVENYSYQIEHYGKILNANRTYYLDRSQPPFYSRTVMEVFEYAQKHKWLGKGEAFWTKWLEPKLPLIEKYYQYWMQEPQKVPETGLSRYYDTGKGPAPESLTSELVDGKSHYDRLKERLNSGAAHDLSHPLSTYFDGESLTDEAYTRDRSMRASGLDPSLRWGLGNLDVIDYNTVDLNCLLYQMEKDGADVANILGEVDQAIAWDERSQQRKEKINKLLWDEEAGLFKDYNTHTKSKLDYPFATMFWPLWCELATRDQADRIREHLKELEGEGGLMSSNKKVDGHWTGCQWDAPWGWAPMQMMAVKGLQRYGFVDDAERIALKFCKAIVAKFVEKQAIFEKYDVVNSFKADEDKRRKPVLGYDDNVIGFGWTNAAFEVFYNGLPQDKREELEAFAEGL